jgi:hypothetical protein
MGGLHVDKLEETASIDFASQANTDHSSTHAR